MALKKIDKETAIKLILDKKKQGIDEKYILKYFLDNFSFTEPTYYNWKKEAIRRYSEFEAKVNPIIEAKEIEALGNIAVSKIMSKTERQILLSEIARGETFFWKEAISKFGTERLETYDPIRAIAELNKMDGAYIESDTENEFKGFEIDEI